MDWRRHHAALAFARLHHDWNWNAAEAEFRKALSLNPNYANAHHWYSHYLLAIGHLRESMAEATLALRLDPLNVSINNHLGHQYLYQGNFDAAVVHLEKLLEIRSDSARTNMLLGKAYEGKRRRDDALAAYRKAAALAPRDRQAIGALGRFMAVTGNSTSARRQIEILTGISEEKKLGFYQIAMIHAALGQKDDAFRSL